MPSYKVHILGGLATYTLAYKVGASLGIFATIPSYYQPFFLGLALLGSIFPDIDITSKMQRLFFLTALIAFPLTLTLGSRQLIIGAGIACLLPILLRHRTITHRAWFLILAPAAAAMILCENNPTQSIKVISSCTFFSLGALSHILLDFGPKRVFSRK